MNISIKLYKSVLVVEQFFSFVLKFRWIQCPFFQSSSLNRMDHSISKQVTKLLQRLKQAEDGAKHLHVEIKDIRCQIEELTQSANRILSEPTLLSNISQVSTRTIAQKRIELDSEDSVDSADIHQSKKPRTDVPIENGYVVVYTDGACENNGKQNAKAGVGVWFGDYHPLNISKPVVGRATNNTAEIQAAVEALLAIQKLGYTKVKIFTDSQFTINCMTKWIKKWKANQWRLAGGGPVKNKEDLVKLDNLCKQFGDIKWEYCPGHKGVKGNEGADQLARAGALRYTAVK